MLYPQVSALQVFFGFYPSLNTIDIMHLHSPTSAILSAVIFNAIVIEMSYPRSPNR